MTQSENQLAEPAALAFAPVLSDKGVADILVMTTPWVRSHADDFRFCNQTVEQWLGSLERLLEAGQVSALLGVPESWVHANADDIPGVLRLGRYVRFRPANIRLLLGGVEVVQ